MPIITIRGELGSGSPEVGKKVAERLGVDYVDREIIADVAKKLKWPDQVIEDKEMPPGSLLGRIAEALGRGYAMTEPSPGGAYAASYLPTWDIPLDDAGYVTALETVIKELATSQSIVIRGRGSQFILKEYPGSVHILLVAGLELRVRRVMKSLKLDESSARKQIERFDSSRREFAKRYFHADLEAPINYDLVINTERSTFDDAASITISALALKAKLSSG